MKAQQTRQLLVQIESELRGIGLWSASAPSSQAMASTMPFCYDTLTFAQWLQFMLLPRLQALLDGGQPLPAQICLCPMAEEALKAHGEAAWPLINRLADLDELLSGKRVQSIARR